MLKTEFSCHLQIGVMDKHDKLPGSDVTRKAISLQCWLLSWKKL